MVVSLLLPILRSRGSTHSRIRHIWGARLRGPDTAARAVSDFAVHHVLRRTDLAAAAGASPASLRRRHPARADCGHRGSRGCRDRQRLRGRERQNRVSTSSSPSSDLQSSGPPLAKGLPTPVDTSPTSVASIAKKLLPSVVTLNVSGSTETGTGSGVVIRADGYIVTNNHVVSGAAATAAPSPRRVLRRQRVAGRASSAATRPATSPSSRSSGTGLPAATLGDSSSLRRRRPGGRDRLAARPRRHRDRGIVSALDRPVRLAGRGQRHRRRHRRDPDRRGDQPGQLRRPAGRRDGAVIGINTAIAAARRQHRPGGGNIGLGFAIPIDTRARHRRGAHPHRHGHAPDVGVTATVHRHRRQPRRRPDRSPWCRAAGRQGGPASGDVIIAVDGKTVGGSEELGRVARHPADTTTSGDRTVSVDVRRRDGKSPHSRHG